MVLYIYVNDISCLHIPFLLLADDAKFVTLKSSDDIQKHIKVYRFEFLSLLALLPLHVLIA